MKNLVIPALCATVLCTPATATVLEYSFVATRGTFETDPGIATVVDDLVTQDTITGRILFSDVVNLFQAPTTDVVFYNAPRIIIDGFDMTRFEFLPSLLGIGNDRGTPTADAIAAAIANPIQLGLQEQVQFLFLDSTATALGDASFPDLISLADFDQAEITVRASLFDANGSALARENVQFDFTSLQPAPVPLPAAGWFLFAALGALAWIRRR